MTVGIPPEIREQRSDEREVFALINALRRQLLATPTSTASTAARTGQMFGFDESDGSGSDMLQPSGAPAGMAQAQFWISSANPSLPYAVDMSALGSGVLQQAVTAGVATPYVFGATSTRIPFGSGVNNALADSLNFTYNDSTGEHLIGVTTANAIAGVAMEVFKSQNAGTTFAFANDSAGANAYTSFLLGNGAANFTTNASFGMLLVGSAGITRVPYVANAGVISLDSGNGPMNFWIDQAAGDFTWYAGTTFPNPPELLRLLHDGRLSCGNPSPYPPGMFAQFNNDVNAPTYLIVSNPNAGNGAEAAVILSQSRVTYTNYLYFSQLSAGYSTSGPYVANAGAIEHVTSGTAHLFISAFGSQDIDFYTTAARTLRFTIANGGNVSVKNLSAGGVVYATNATAVLKIGTSAEVASAITWPTADQVLVSSGTTTAPVGDTRFTWDTTGNGGISLSGTSPIISWYNATGGNFERVRSFWSSNVWTLKSEKGGTGVLRAMEIDADTQTITVNGSSVDVTGSGGTGAVQNWYKVTGANFEGVIGKFISTYTYGSDFWVLQAQLGGAGAQQSIAIDALAGAALLSGISSSLYAGSSVITVNDNAGVQQNIHTSQFSRTSAAGMVADMHKFNSNLTISSNVNITTATGVNAMVIGRPVYDGGGVAKTITHAASVYIANSPNPTNSLAITNAYALWIDAGLLRYDGAIALGGGAAATLGTIGGGGPGTAAQNKWLSLNVDGTVYYLPLWI